MTERAGFTLMELLVVLIIIGVLVVLNTYGFGKTSEKNKAKQAEANLRVIYSAQQRYFLDQGGYYACASQPCDNDNITTDLGVDINDDYFNYSIIATNSPVASFNATAARLSPSQGCDGERMTINSSGGQVEKGCLGIW